MPVIPDADFSNKWLYVVNYYGQLKNEKIEKISNSAKKLIVDNVQAFFQPPVAHVQTIYNCRKYFGVADGAYLYSDKELKRDIHKDNSFNRYEFLRGVLKKLQMNFTHNM